VCVCVHACVCVRAGARAWVRARVHASTCFCFPSCVGCDAMPLGKNCLMYWSIILSLSSLFECLNVKIKVL